MPGSNFPRTWYKDTGQHRTASSQEEAWETKSVGWKADYLDRSI